jgi:DNA-binding CsgD family transcriptional regulator
MRWLFSVLRINDAAVKEPLSQTDFEEILGCIEEIYACRSLEDFPRELLVALNKLIPSEVTGYNEVNLRRNRTIMVLEPSQGPEYMKWQKGFQDHIAEHPLVTYMNTSHDGQALMISDFLSAEEFHRLNLYRECYGPVRVEDQLAMGVVLDEGFIIGIAFNRSSRSFSEKDRMRLNMVRPHVIQAYRHAQDRAGFTDQVADLQKALEENGRGLIAAHVDGTVIHATPGAFDCLRRYVAVSESEPAVLPASLVRWAAKNVQGNESMAVPGTGATLVIRRVVQADRVLLMLSEETAVADSPALARYGLTRRESEVLHWLVESKSNSEIALLLGLTAGTVKVHVEHILAKLGVPNRTAAAMLVRSVVHG